MDKEVRDWEVSLELCRKTATPDCGVLPKAGTGPSGPQLTRGTKRHDPTASKEAYGCILAWGREAGKVIPTYERQMEGPV